MAGLRKRRKLFIARRFQIRFILIILLFMFAISILTGYTVYYTTWVLFGEKLAAVYPQGFLLDIVNRVNMILLLRLLMISPLVIFIGLVLSHRIAGPIYQIKKYIWGIVDGKYEDELKLRRKDELWDLADSLNCLVTGLRSERYRRRECAARMEKEIDELKTAILDERSSAEDLLKRIRSISEQLRSLRG
jgi:signal transduction histidine kinase